MIVHGKIAFASNSVDDPEVLSRALRPALTIIDRVVSPRHGRPCAGHPRLSCDVEARRGWPGQAWTSPAMTTDDGGTACGYDRHC
jgi:hypothetical protein